jgi:hypothetical protein
MTDEASKKLGPGSKQQKSEAEAAVSYGVARYLILSRPLGFNVVIALL